MSEGRREGGRERERRDEGRERERRGKGIKGGRDEGREGGRARREGGKEERREGGMKGGRARREGGREGGGGEERKMHLTRKIKAMTLEVACNKVVLLLQFVVPHIASF